MKIIINVNEQVSASMMEHHFQASGLPALVTAAPKEMMLEILKSCKFDLAAYYTEEIDNNETVDFFNEIKKINPDILCVLFLKKEKLSRVGEDIENCFDECFAIPVDSYDLMIRLRRLMKTAVKREASSEISQQNKTAQTAGPEAPPLEQAIPPVYNPPEAPPVQNTGFQSGRDIYTKPVYADYSFVSGDDCAGSAGPADKAFQSKTTQTGDGFKMNARVIESESRIFGQQPEIKKGETKKQKSAAGKFFGFVSKAVFFLLIVVIAVLAAFLVQGKISGGTPTVAGFQLYGVLSGSMNGKEKTSFDTGSLVIVKYKPVEDIQVGDIITFRGLNADSPVTTHRVVKVNKADSKDGILSFTTKGDANDVADPNPVLASRVVGTVRMHIPYAGYLTGFAETKTGLILLVFIPGGAVIVYELVNIFKTVKNEKKKGKAK